VYFKGKEMFLIQKIDAFGEKYRFIAKPDYESRFGDHKPKSRVDLNGEPYMEIGHELLTSDQYNKEIAPFKIG
jgi:hypothetical protein